MGKKRVDRVELNKYIQSLGLETYGIDLNHIVRNPMSNYRPVSALYTVGLQALFGLLMRHQIQDNLIDPTDPNSLSKKIDEFLKKDGPMIWPEPGPGEKRHLLKPQDGISYIRDLIYLRDCAILKERLLAILLCQGASSETDSEFYTMETHNDSETLEFDSDDTIAMDILGTKRGSIDKINDETASQRTESEEGETDNSFNESEDSVLDSRVTSQASNRNTNPSDPAFKVELRLYRSKKPRALVGPGTTWSYATLMLTERTKLCEDFFVLICDEIEADCSFAIFHLPEDMSMEDSVRIDRESRESELLFRRIRSILQRARVFPCGPLRRSVEVEVGLGTD